MVITNIIKLTTHFISSVKWLTEISFEFYFGFLKLHKINTPCVTVFGSARFNENNHHYQITFHLGQELGKAGFAVMTGGGPGLMEAANRGAKEAGGLSIGCNI